MKLPKIISVILVNLVSNFSYSTVYMTTTDGNWNDAVWNPGVPPNPLANGDEINVLHTINLNVDVTINGNININASGNLSGSKNIIINASGQIQNDGTVSVDNFTNHGSAINNNFLTTSNNLTNDGTFTNNAAGTVSVLNSKDFDNKNGILINHGNMNIDHDLKNDNGNVTNNGTLNVNHNWDNKNGNATNNGNVHIAHDLKNDPGTFTNNGNVTVDNNIKNKDGVLNGNGGSYIAGNHLDNNDGTIDGNITVCGSDGSSNPIINGGFVGGSVVICFSVLPLELVSFGAEQQNHWVQLTWHSASENNLEEYVVEKSADGAVFSSIATKKAVNTASEYFSEDRSLESGTRYYRLRQVRKDASYFYSEVVTVNIQPDETVFNVYPNPVVSGDNIHILYANPSSTGGEVLINVFDVTGKNIYSKVVLQQNNGVWIATDLSGNLAPGIYFVTGSSDNEVFHRKISVVDSNAPGAVFATR